MKKRRLFALLTALALIAALIPAAGAAEAAQSHNINAQEYVNGRRWATTVKSYLYENARGGLTRVEYTGEKVVVEDYDGDFGLLSSRTVETELPRWGGFFAGKDYNFIICGQYNEEEDNSKEVIRIVQYDKDWNRLGSAGLYGANTIHPFDAGSLRCDEYGGYLYIRTCHEMYTTSDGLNHQANVMIVLRQSDMTITDSFYLVESSVGYVSHSFNQFILIDSEGRIVTLDHGDAYPRSALLQRYAVKAGQDSFRLAEKDKWIWTNVGGGHMVGKPAPASEEATLAVFPGSVGANDTGAALGGLAETANGYVAVYNYDGVASSLGGADRDVYLAFVSKDELSVKNVKLSGGTDTSVPQLAPTGPDGGYVLWNTRNNKGWYSASFGSTLYYAAYDAGGNVGAVKTAEAPLSDCAPILWNGRVVWYVTNGGAPTFYLLGANGVTTRTPGAPTAYAAPQTVLVDGKEVEFQMYALKDSYGNKANYIKVRDLALALNGTKAQFEVGWDNAAKLVTIENHKAYTPNDTENQTPFSGERAYTPGGKTKVDGTEFDLAAIVLKDDQGGGYTYYKLRDLGKALDFNVSWDGAAGIIVVNTDQPYSED